MNYVFNEKMYVEGRTPETQINVGDFLLDSGKATHNNIKALGVFMLVGGREQDSFLNCVAPLIAKKYDVFSSFFYQGGLVYVIKPKPKKGIIRSIWKRITRLKKALSRLNPLSRK